MPRRRQMSAVTSDSVCPKRRRRVRSTCSARSRSPSRNQSSPPSAPMLSMNDHGRCCVSSTGPAHSTETLAQARQHVLAVEFQKARLVWSRRVEHQIPETETDIVTDPLDVLVGVAGYDPSTGGAL